MEETVHMTTIIINQVSLDGLRECAVRCDKSGCFQAVVYENVYGCWSITHESKPTRARNKAMAAFRRFAAKYL